MVALFIFCPCEGKFEIHNFMTV